MSFKLFNIVDKIIMLGSHIKFENSSISQTLQSAYKYDCKSFQFFLGSNLSTKRSVLKDSDIQQFNKLNDMYKINCFSHLPYVHNLCGSIKHNQLAWQETETYDKIFENIHSIQTELEQISKLNALHKGCVLHIGSCPSKYLRNDALISATKSINQIKIPSNTYLLLETMVGRGGVIGSSFNELEQIIKNCSNAENIKICIDTCHVYANGNYNLSETLEVDRMFDEFQLLFDINKLGLIHLNDSKVEFNAKQDKHACIGQGKIWSNSDESYKHLMRRCSEMNLPVVLETDIEDLLNAKTRL